MIDLFSKFTQTEGEMFISQELQDFEHTLQRLVDTNVYTGQLRSTSFQLKDASDSMLRIEGRYMPKGDGVRILYQIKPDPKAYKMILLIIAVWLLVIGLLADLWLFAAAVVLSVPLFIILPFYSRGKPSPGR